jgi:hypothetical protein
VAPRDHLYALFLGQYTRVMIAILLIIM